MQTSETIGKSGFPLETKIVIDATLVDRNPLSKRHVVNNFVLEIFAINGQSCEKFQIAPLAKSKFLNIKNLHKKFRIEGYEIEVSEKLNTNNLENDKVLKFKITKIIAELPLDQ